MVQGSEANQPDMFGLHHELGINIIFGCMDEYVNSVDPVTHPIAVCRPMECLLHG